MSREGRRIREWLEASGNTKKVGFWPQQGGWLDEISLGQKLFGVGVGVGVSPGMNSPVIKPHQYWRPKRLQNAEWTALDVTEPSCREAVGDGTCKLRQSKWNAKRMTCFVSTSHLTGRPLKDFWAEWCGKNCELLLQTNPFLIQIGLCFQPMFS